VTAEAGDMWGECEVSLANILHRVTKLGYKM